MIDASRGHDPDRIARASSEDTHDYGVLSFTDVIVKSSNVGAIKIGLKLGAERLSEYVRRFGFGAAGVAGLSRREPGHRLEPGQVDRQRARVGVDGLPGRRDAAADGRRPSARSPTAASCIEPRVVRAVYRGGRRYDVQPKVRAPHDQRRTRRPTLTDDHGGGRRARHGAGARRFPGYTIAGKTGTAAKLVNGRYSHVRLQRVVRRLRPVAQAGRRRSSSSSTRRTAGRTTAGRCRRRSSSGSPRRRCATSASRRRSTRRRRCSWRAATSRRRRPRPRRAAGEPVVSLVADGPPGTRAGPARPERARGGADARAARADRARVRRRRSSSSQDPPRGRAARCRAPSAALRSNAGRRRGRRQAARP